MGTGRRRPEASGQLGVAGTLDGYDPIAALLQGPGDGIDGGGSDAAGDHYHGAEVVDFGGVSQRADQGVELVARGQGGQLPRRGPNGHQHQGDSAGGGVKVGDGKGYSLAALVGHHDHKVAGLSLGGHLGGLYQDLVDAGNQFRLL